jgi:ribonuclease BN (tRNA processing enzyme)
LLRTGAAAVLLDIGPGAFSKLQLTIDYSRVDAIVISHMHADHFFDLVPLRYGLKYGPQRRAELMPLWLPPGGRESLQALRRAVSPNAPADFFDSVYAVSEYDPAQTLAVRDMRLSFCSTRHYVPAFAVRAECGLASMTYSADTGPSDALVALASDTSVFLCEAALGLETENGERGHSSAEEAGEMARCARAKRLLLTHYSSSFSSEALVGAASRHFRGPVEAADDGMEVKT